ncbi:MAG: pentapeptide repeat-containing protein [Bacteriovoracia bacterium]
MAWVRKSRVFVIFLGLLSLGSKSSEDQGFRFQAGKCVNARGETGLNPSYLGQCGDLRGSAFGRLDFDRIDLRGSDFSNAELGKVTFRGAQLEGTKWDSASLQGVDFSEANLTGSVFTGSRFSRVVMGAATLDGADFSRSTWKDSEISYCEWNKARFTKAVFESTTFEELSFGNASFAEARFSSPVFKQCVFRGVSAENATFIGVNLRRADFRGANLKGVQLIRAPLEEAGFEDADLTLASFRFATLARARFTKAKLAGTDFAYADLTGASTEGAVWTDATYNRRTKLPFPEADAKTLGMKEIQTHVARLYYNPRHVDSGASTTDNEPFTLWETIKQFEDSAQFTDYSLGALKKTLGESTVVIFPEFEIGDPNSDFGTEHRNALKEYVMNGGRLVFHGDANNRANVLIANVFGLKVPTRMSPAAEQTLQVEAAKETLFEGTSTQALSVNNQTSCLTGLSDTVKAIYKTPQCATVTLYAAGKGTVIFLGYDWFNAKPAGGQDGGWVDTLIRVAGPN